MKWLVTALFLSASIVNAQGILTETLDPIDPIEDMPLRELGTETVQNAARSEIAEGAVLRGLDKLNGDVVDFELKSGFSVGFGDLRIDLAQCKYPEDNPTGEGYGFLTVYDSDNLDDPVFQGWMIASSPALSAMDHARYDVWIMRCMTP